MKERKTHLLVVEDEAAISTGLRDVFLFHGYDVTVADDGREGLELALTGTYDLLLLDVMLPGVDGYEILRRVREIDRDQPVIMLTARSGDDDVIQGLTLGADDYVAKPFSVAQLVLRVRAVLRRARAGTEAAQTLALGDDVSVDCVNLCGTLRGEAVTFTRREMELLAYLAAHRERAVSREELLNKVWGYAREAELETRTVDIHVAKLRRKVEPDPANPTYLVTVRGAGYRLLGD